MKGRRGRLVGLLALVVVLAACGDAGRSSPSPEASERPETATPEPAAATVVDVVNDVDAHPQAAGEWEDAQEEMAIYEGGEVWARDASTARVDVSSPRVMALSTITPVMNHWNPGDATRAWMPR